MRLTRREMVEKILGGMAVSAGWPLIASSHPIHEHLKKVMLDLANGMLEAPDWKPLFLNAKQNETLIALSETIVPGSTKAQVNRFIDLLLSVDIANDRQKFIESLATIDSEGQNRFGREFHTLTSIEQTMLLTTVSNAKANHEYFDNLKEWIALAYYSSEAGMRELGWNGNYTFDTFPGCKGEDRHQ